MLLGQDERQQGVHAEERAGQQTAGRRRPPGCPAGRGPCRAAAAGAGRAPARRRPGRRGRRRRGRAAARRTAARRCRHRPAVPTARCCGAAARRRARGRAPDRRSAAGRDRPRPAAPARGTPSRHPRCVVTRPAASGPISAGSTQRGGEGPEQAGAQPRRVGLPGDDVEQHDDDARPEALHRPADDEHAPCAGRCRRRADRRRTPARREAAPRRGQRRSPSVAAEHHADHRGDEEGAERPPYQARRRARPPPSASPSRRPSPRRRSRVTSMSRPTVVRRWPGRRCPPRPRRSRPANLAPLAGASRPRRHASSAGPRGGRRSRLTLLGAATVLLLRAVICSVAAGTTVFRSPMTPKSASSKIGASGSLLMATMVFEVCMPARCWMAPEMPTAT